DGGIAAGKAECEQKDAAFKALMDKMDKHLRNYPRPNAQTHDEFRGLLEQAEQIDLAHGRVALLRQKYNAREGQVRR
ncbi:MAG: hypothetical protein WAW26_23560, partial [Anaerolineae bacterium]